MNKDPIITPRGAMWCHLLCGPELVRVLSARAYGGATPGNYRCEIALMRDVGRGAVMAMIGPGGHLYACTTRGIYYPQ